MNEYIATNVLLSKRITPFVSHPARNKGVDNKNKNKRYKRLTSLATESVYYFALDYIKHRILS